MGSFDASYKNRRGYKNKKDELEKFNIIINDNLFENFFYYVISRNRAVTKKCLRDLNIFLNMINEERYENEKIEIYYLLLVTKEILNMRLHENIDNVNVWVQVLSEKFIEVEWLKEYYDLIILATQSIETFEEDYFNIEDIYYINHFVSSRLTNKQIYIGREKLLPIFEELDEDEINIEKLNDRFISTIEKLYNNCMKFKAESEHVIEDFELLDEEQSNFVIERTVEEYNKENNKIKTGLARFNQILNGGFENGRTYNACAVPKAWKSGFLLNTALWSIKYNKSFELKNANKKPTVFYLSLENSVRETINRLYVYLTGKSLKGISIKEAKKVIKKELIEKYGVNLVIKYRPARSISTLDFDNMIDEIETNNNEVVLAILDYTKRIKSSDFNPELRIELGQVMDDLCVIAKRRNIPILTASQLNREAYRAIEQAILKGKKDIAKELNSSHIGESVGLIENADVSFIINKEVSDEINPETGEKDKWLSVKMMTSREETDDEKGGVYFAQPFMNGMRLEEDEGLSKQLWRETIEYNVEEEFSPERARDKLKKRKNPKKINLNNTDEEDEENDYASGKLKNRKPQGTCNYTKGFKNENNDDLDDEDEFNEEEDNEQEIEE